MKDVRIPPDERVANFMSMVEIVFIFFFFFLSSHFQKEPDSSGVPGVYVWLQGRLSTALLNFYAPTYALQYRC